MYLSELAQTLPAQIREGYNMGRAIDLPKTITAILCVGMGGSVFGADIVQALSREWLSVPLIIHRDYTVPAWVNENTLVVLLSFSGTTEEVLEVAKNVSRRTPHIIVSAAGGPLLTHAQGQHLTTLPFSPPDDLRTCGRFGFGYSFGVVIAIAEMYQTQAQQISDTLNTTRSVTPETSIMEWCDTEKELCILSAEHLNGNARLFAHQVHETLKRHAVWYSLPEANHHLLESFADPSMKQRRFVFLSSTHYHPRNQKRLELTADLLAALGHKTQVFTLPNTSRLEEVLQYTFLSTTITAEIAQRRALEPSKMAMVERFKAALG